MIRAGSIVLAAIASAGAAPPGVDRRATTPVTTVTRDELEKIPRATSIEDLIRRCPARTIPTVDTSPQGAAGGNRSSVGCVQPDDLRMIDIYREHNRIRGLFGARPLLWDRQLVLGAEDRARTMARTGQFAHAPRAGRDTVRENIARVPLQYSPSQMMAGWLAERTDFVPGVFPNICRSGGDCSGVLHLSQMLWPTTTNIGCGAAIGGGSAWLVCRYNPGGNKGGVAVGRPTPDRQQLALACRYQGGIMMCPGPGEDEEGGQPAGNDAPPAEQPGGQPEQPTQPGQAPPVEDNATRERPRPPAVTPNDGISRVTGNCGASVIAKIRITERPDPRNPNKRLRTKESHNLSHGFSEVVIPFGWDATVDFRPDPDPKKTFPDPGRMDARWSIVGQPNPHTADVTGGYAKLQTGKWDNEGGLMDVNPQQRPTVQQHSIFAEWNPQPPTNPDKCPTGHDFLVTFAAEVPNPDELDLKDFVDQAAAARNTFPGTRPRTRYTTQTRAFHTASPQPFSRPGYVLVPIGIYWDLPDDCCGIKRAKREVIQFARAAIEGPNGRQGKGWGLDVLPDELNRNGNHDPVYTGHPNEHGKDRPTAGGAGGTQTLPNGDAVQWDAPGMPKDLFDRLQAAQGASIYRQQFLSLLVCQKPARPNRVREYLDHAKVCQVAITTVRWDFPGQAGVQPRAPRPGAPPVMPYRQPRITISFDVRDGNCRPLSEFLEQNGFLDAFRNPSSEARKLEIMPDTEYRQLGGNVNDWEANPFGEVRIQPRAQ